MFTQLLVLALDRASAQGGPWHAEIAMKIMHAHVVHMWCTCGAHVVHVWCICGPHVVHVRVHVDAR